jgi:hypothetical protein
VRPTIIRTQFCEGDESREKCPTSAFRSEEQDIPGVMDIDLDGITTQGTYFWPVSI